MIDMNVLGPASNLQLSGAQFYAALGPLAGMTGEQLQKLTTSVLIQILGRPSEGITFGLGRSIGIWARCDTPVGICEDQFGGNIEFSRANMAKTFLQYCNDHPETEYVVMIDNDQDVPDWAPYKLALWDLPVVGGVVCNWKSSRGLYACFTVKDDNGVPRFPSQRFSGNMPASGLIEADSLGTGLICIKKSVLESMLEAGMNPFEISPETRKESFESGVLKSGEDISFSKQCEKLGFKRYVDLSVRAIHYKTMALQWNPSKEDYAIDAKDWKVDRREYRHG